MGLAAVAILMLGATGAQAGITLLTENFDSIGSGGTAPPTGWTVGNRTPVASRQNDANAAITSQALVVDNGGGVGGTNGLSYNYGTTGASDRAVGNVPKTGLGDRIIQVAVTNNSGFALPDITLDYWGEQWHRGEAKCPTQPEKLRLYFSTLQNTGYVSMGSTFEFIAPVNTPQMQQIALDGNAAANRTHITGAYVLGSPIANGATFYIRWYDWNDDQTVDHGLAVDDVIVGSTVPEPATLGLLAVGGLLALRRRRR
jgi:hypothetical protein